MKGLTSHSLHMIVPVPRQETQTDVPLSILEAACTVYTCEMDI